MKLVIFGNNYQDTNVTSILMLVDRLRSRGVQVTLDEDFHHYLQACVGSLVDTTEYRVELNFA